MLKYYRSLLWLIISVYTFTKLLSAATLEEKAFEIYLEAEVYKDRNEYDNAITAYKQAISIDSTEASYYWRLGNAYEERNASNSNDNDNAITAYKQAISTDSTDARYYFSLGKAYFFRNVKNFKLAINEFKKAIHFDSTNATYYYFLGGAYSADYRNEYKDYELAISAYKKAIHFDSTKASYYWSLGNAYEKSTSNSNNIKIAINLYKVAVKLAPVNITYHYSLASAYNKIDENEEALLEYKNIIKIGPQDDWDNVNVQNAYENACHLLLKSNKISEASDLYHTLKKTYPNNAESYSHLGLAIDSSVRMNQTTSNQLESIHFEKAIKLSKTGLYNESLNEYTLSIEKNEGKPEAYLYKGAILLEKREYESALYNFNKAEKLGVNKWFLYYWRTDIYSYQKEFKLVVKDLNKALSLLPASEVETRKEIEMRVNDIQSALDIPVVGEFLADPNKQPTSHQPSFTPRKPPELDFNFKNNTQTTQPRKQVKEKETCSFCNGTGEGLQCYSCNGTGIKTENCFSCNGTGRGYSGNKCLNCDGRGFKNSRCYFCNGKGNKPCTYCNGRGIR